MRYTWKSLAGHAGTDGLVDPHCELKPKELDAKSKKKQFLRAWTEIKLGRSLMFCCFERLVPAAFVDFLRCQR